MPERVPKRPRATLLTIVLLWAAFYASFTLFAPPLLDDADSVHVEVAREMLLRRDPVTLYANGIRYLEKAPLLYWSMALSMRVFGVSAAAARVPLALTMLALALVMEALARRLFQSAPAGLYAALILLSSFGMFLFTRIMIPDAMVCLWVAAAMYCFWRTEETAEPRRVWCRGFAAACALNVLTKGLIGVVFPAGIVLLYLLLTRGVRRALKRVKTLHVASSLLVFLLLAAPWHIAAGLANPGHGQPARFQFVGGHWTVPLPTDGNVRGWFWFYFMNEHLLRYMNLRVPHDYDTAPLWLFWGLCFLWLMPWSAFGFKALRWTLRHTGDRNASFSADFVRSPIGEYHFGEITAEMAAAAEIAPGMIRLRTGDDSVGLVHIVKTRGVMMREQFGSVENFVQYVGQNLDAIYRKATSRDGEVYDVVVNRPPVEGMHGRLILRVTQHPGEDYYDVLSAMRMRSDQFKNKRPLWERTGTSALSAEADPLIPEAKAAATMHTNRTAGLHPNALGDGSSGSIEQESRASNGSLLPAERGRLLLAVWAVVVLGFFSLSTRQEYYVLPALPALALLLAGWLAKDSVLHIGKAWQRCVMVLLALGSVVAAASVFFLLHTKAPASGTDLATLLVQNPSDYALSLGHFLDLNAQAVGMFRFPLALAAASLFGGPLVAYLLRRRGRAYAANLALAAGAFGFLLTVHMGLKIFAPVLTSAQLAEAVRDQVRPEDMVVIHGEYESGSSLGFYLRRSDIHIVDGRSSNLWYGSFFPDAPAIFETEESFAAKWAGPRRIFLWQSVTDPPNQLPALPGPRYILVKNGGKEIVSNQPNR